MNVAEWILVVILSVTLLVFLIVGIVLMSKTFGLVAEAKKVVAKSQDIAENANGVVTNVRGMTSIGGTVEEVIKERKKDDDGRKEK